MENEKIDKVKIQMRLTKESKDDVKFLAKKLGVSENAIVSIAVNEYVKSQLNKKEYRYE